MAPSDDDAGEADRDPGDRHVNRLSHDERARLRSLHVYGILDTPADGAFDRVTELVAELMDVPVAVVSLVDHDRIWFKSHHGLEVQQIDREPGLCASAILQDDFYEVTDASVDPRTLTNPLVAGEMGVRFYLGHPLTTPDGHNLGMLCVLDVEPREVTERDRQIIGTMAEVVMDQMNLRLSARRIYDLNCDLKSTQEQLEYQVQHDALTGLWNRPTINAFLSKSLDRARRSARPVTVVMIDLDNFKSINDTHGHAAGDEVLVETSRRLTSTGRTADVIGRLGGEEFLAVFDETSLADGAAAAERYRAKVADRPYVITGPDGPLEVSITASFGLGSTEGQTDISAKDLINEADDALYEAKRTGRNRVVCNDVVPRRAG
ncbi:MAG: diguanylate cyclase [Actinomycetales bacterium]